MSSRPDLGLAIYPHEVALSFAGEDRAYVEEVAASLRNSGIEVFYFDYQEVDAWGEDLSVFLDKIFRVQARFVVPFISSHYVRKPWPTHEFRSALARAINEHDTVYVLPVRLDDTELPGLRPSIAFIDGREKSPTALASLIVQKVRGARADAELEPQPFDAKPEPLTRGEEISLTNFGPSTWCTFGAANRPEVILRVVASSPGVLELRSNQPDFATRLRGEEREQVILDSLERSSFTHWLVAQQESWHWEGAPGWEVIGATGYADLTELVFPTIWDRHAVREPFSARCHVLTGWLISDDRGIPRPGAVVALDVQISLLELDQGRRWANMAYRTTPPPAPAALSVEELAGIFKKLLINAPTITRDIGPRLVDSAGTDEGAIAAWLDLSGVELERVVDLTRFRRLRDSVNSSGRMNAARLPLSEAEAPGTPEDKFVADLINDLLEPAGFRGTREMIQALRQGAGDGHRDHVPG